MEAWRSSLIPRIAEAKANLANFSLLELARKSGASFGRCGLVLDFLGKSYVLTQDLALLDKEKGEPALEEMQAIIFDYLLHADGRQPKDEWIGFSELPHGNFYVQAFQSYTGDELVRRLDGEGFKKGAERAGGAPIALGDVGYAFRPLPLLAMAVVWWDGEEGLFPPKAVVLFDAHAAGLLPTEGLAIVGRLLCRRIVKFAEEG